jgi:hypothetical protein
MRGEVLCKFSSEFVTVVVDEINGDGGLVTVTDVVNNGVDFVLIMSSNGELVGVVEDSESSETNIKGRVAE